MSVIRVSHFAQAEGLRTGRFDQVCERCPAAHREYGLVWAECDSCQETVCDDCLHPGSKREIEHDAGDEAVISVVGMCKRCADTAQEATVR